MKMETITSDNEEVRAELETCQREFALWLIMIANSVHGRVLVRCEPNECASYKHFSLD